MESWVAPATDWLWYSAVSAVPMALLIALVCRWLPARPATRHSLWLVALLWFAVPPLLPSATLPLSLTDLFIGMSASPAAVPRPTSTPPTAAPGMSARPAIIDPDSPSPPARITSAPLPALTTRSHAAPDATRSRADRPAPAQPAKPPQPRALRPDLAPIDGALQPWPSSPTASPAGSPPRASASPAAHAAPERAPLARTAEPTSAARSARPPASADSRATDSPPPVASTPLWRAWLAVLLELRALLFRLPPIPWHVWLAGVLLIVAVRGAQHLFFLHRLRRAVPAPAAVRRMLAEVAHNMSLPRQPRTFFVDDHLSPLVTCGRRARLILPARLWAELDDPGRRAILCHELAHLRRKDHWICWAALLVGAVYWWNPLVWWVRRRLNDEAELCCDAWVTWLMPDGRRAYAEALLRTRLFVGRPAPAATANAVNSTSRRSRRFARRLTMVMTQRTRPRLSSAGLGLVLTLALAGWATAPAWSCPDEAKAAKAPAAAKAHAHGHGVAVVAPTPPPAPPGAAVPPAPPAPPAPPTPPSPPAPPAPHAHAPAGFAIAFGPSEGDTPAPRAHGHGHGALFAGGGDEDDDDELEARIERLERMIEKIVERMEADAGRPSGRVRVERPERIAPQPAPPAQRRTPPREPASGTFELPGGKLEAMVALMSRDDVPVMIRPGGDSFEVLGPEEQQDIVGAFVDIIGPSNSARTYVMSSGKASDLYALMSRDDVVLYVSGGGDSITINATDAQHEAIEDFILLIDPDARVGRSDDAVDLDAARLADAERKRAIESRLGARAAAGSAQQLAAAELRRAAEALAQAKVDAGRQALLDAEKQLAVGRDALRRSLAVQSGALMKERQALREKVGAEREALRSMIRAHAGEAADARAEIQAQIEAILEATEELRDAAPQIADEIRAAVEEMIAAQQEAAEAVQAERDTGTR